MLTGQVPEDHGSSVGFFPDPVSGAPIFMEKVECL
jgi:hypothetical protein